VLKLLCLFLNFLKNGAFQSEILHSLFENKRFPIHEQYENLATEMDWGNKQHC